MPPGSLSPGSPLQQEARMPRSLGHLIIALDSALGEVSLLVSQKVLLQIDLPPGCSAKPYSCPHHSGEQSGELA